MKDNSCIAQLADKLFDFFCINPRHWGKQLPDGKYNTVNKHLYPANIKRMIEKQGSILTYQEAQGYLKWICFDIDIKKEFQERFADCKDDLKNVIDKLTVLLGKHKISFLIECSGRRGFHIWIIFQHAIKKFHGFAIIDTICCQLGELPTSIAIDRFPKTKVVNPKTKGLGLGVKLPLSFHTKSSKYSFFVDPISDNTFEPDAWPTKVDEKFIEKQFEILSNYDLQNPDIIAQNLGINLIEYEGTTEENYVKAKELIVPKENSLDKIMNEFMQCNCLKSILKEYHAGLGNTERLILVGLFSRLCFKDNENFGIHLLKELFSRFPNYNEDLTDQKLLHVKNFYPPTCEYLKKKFHTHCEGCPCENKKTPIELLSNTKMMELDWHEIDESLFNKLKFAQGNYTYFNDEVPLNHILNYLKNYQLSDFSSKITKLLDGTLNVGEEFYRFKRNEGGGKERELICIGSGDKILSTIATNYLHSFWYGSFSSSSYGYRFSESFSKNRIFESWLTLWKEYIKKVRDIVEDEDCCYDDYYLIKIDLETFYDSIDQQRLRIKLFDDPIPEIAQRLKTISTKDKAYYENIINYIFRLCKMTNPTKGLPQGPAFARYLAEIYLIGLDRKIEDNLHKGFEFYFRYVDDIFIFVKDYNQKQKMNAAIHNWLSLNHLSQNQHKSLAMKVSNFKKNNSLSNYINKSKYFIDQVSKHKAIATNEELNDSIQQTYMLLQHTEWGIKDHFRFIIHHLNDGFVLSKEKFELGDRILTSDEGRGSLYTIFFDKYYLKTTTNLLSTNTLKKMNSLAYECYLNSLIRFETDINEVDEMRKHVEMLIQGESGNLSNSAKMNLLQLALKYEISLANEFLSSLDWKDIRIIIASPEKYKLPLVFLTEEAFSGLFPQDIECDEFIESLFFITYNNHIPLKGLSKLANYFWLRSTENDGKFFRDFKKKIPSNFLNKFYNMLCLFSIVLNDLAENKVALIEIWKIFLENINSFDTFESQCDWFYCLEHEEFKQIDPSIWCVCITMDQEGGLLETCNDEKHKILDKFREIVLTILSNDKKLMKMVFDNPGESKLAIEALKMNDKFVEWIYDNEAILYPGKDCCFSNIVHNNLVVMKKNNEYLVKSLNSKLIKYDYLPDCVLYNDDKTAIFKKNDDFKKIENNFKHLTVIEIFKKIIELYEGGELFKKEFGCQGFPNYFIEDTYLNDSLFPHLPHYSNCEYLFSEDLIKEKNNEKGFCSLVLRQLLKQNVQIFQGEGTSYFYQLNGQSENKFFPISVKYPEDKIAFLKKFIEISKRYDSRTFSYHSFERTWAQTYWEYLEKKTSNEKDFVYIFFEHYFGYHLENHPENPELFHLLFAVEDIETLDTSLACFFKTFKDSVAIPCISKKISEIGKTIQDRINLFLEQNELSENSIELDGFKKSEIQAGVKKVPGQQTEIFRLFDEKGKEIYSDSLGKKCLFFDLGSDDNIQELTKDNHNLLIVKSSWLKYACSKENFFFIVIMPKQFQKSMESLIKRKEWLNAWSDFTDSNIKLLFNYEDIISKISDDIDTVLEKTYNHYYPLRKNKKNEIRERIINWLLLFNEASIKGSKVQLYMRENDLPLAFLYKAILYIVISHDCITEEDVEKFNNNFNKLKGCEDTLIFSLKTLEDTNGLQHLLNLCDGSALREADITDCYHKVINKTENHKKLVFLCDVGLSGTEFRKAMEYYIEGKIDTKNNDTREEAVFKEKYFSYSVDNNKEREKFVEKFTNFDEIVIIAALVTKEFKEKTTEVIKKYFKQERIFSKIHYMESRELCDFTYRQKEVSSKVKNLFFEFVNDVDLLKKLFEDNWKFYRKSLKVADLSKTNLVLRLQSTPKKRFRIFTIKPKDPKIKKLFDRRKD